MEPSLLRLLKIFRDAKKGLTEKDIVNLTKEKQDYIDKALEKLVKVGVLTKKEELYQYEASTYSEDLYKKMSALYEEVDKREQMELLVRGLLSYDSRYLICMETLLDILKKEEYGRQESFEFLEEEVKNGWVKIVRITFKGREKALPIFIWIPSHYLHYNFRFIDLYEYKKLGTSGEDLRSDGEEDYLKAQYPPELAKQAREYLEKEKKEIMEELRKEISKAFGSLATLMYSSLH